MEDRILLHHRQYAASVGAPHTAASAAPAAAALRSPSAAGCDSTRTATRPRSGGQTTLQEPDHILVQS